MAGKRETIVDRADKSLDSPNGAQRPAALAPGAAVTFRDPKPISELERSEGTAEWLWHGYFARQTTTLLSSMWKVGKTTLIAHLLKAFSHGGLFCGRTVRPAKVLYVTEEPEWVWAVRRDKIGIADHVHVQSRPFRLRPSLPEWVAFIDHVRKHAGRIGAELVFIDPLTTIWPVSQENEAGPVAEALTPLHALTDLCGVVLLHHFRKSDGQELTGSRGSGALMGFVDTILELRRFAPTNLKDTRRVLTGGGRFEETPDELVVELTDGGYVAQGDRVDVKRRELSEVIRSVLTREEPGWPWETVKRAVDDALGEDGPGPGKGGMLAALNAGAESGLWFRTGEGVRGDSFRYRLNTNTGAGVRSVSDSFPIGVETENETPEGSIPD